jgi:hypothetical protein
MNTVEEIKAPLFTNNARKMAGRPLRRKKDKKENIAYRDQSVQDVLEAEVKRFRCIPEVTHKHWQELGLMSPLSPEDTPKYEFQNLNLRTYYEIYI